MLDDETPDSVPHAVSRDARILAHQLDALERYLVFLRLARRVRQDNGGDVKALDELIKRGDDEIQVLHGRADGRILPRARPRGTNHGPRSSCTVFIDECGSHSVSAKDPFGVFVLAAVIIPDTEYLEIDRRWKEWKQANLGSSDKIVHEPDVRYGKGPFWAEGNPEKRAVLRTSLNKVLGELNFSAIICVLHRDDVTTHLVELQNNCVPTYRTAVRLRRPRGPTWLRHWAS